VPLAFHRLESAKERLKAAVDLSENGDYSVDKQTSKWIERAKLYREQADYSDFFVISKEEAEN
jgi:uncharacterized protein (UPF0332 family)